MNEWKNQVVSIVFEQIILKIKNIALLNIYESLQLGNSKKRDF